MQHRNAGATRKLGNAADVAGGDHLRLCCRNVGELPGFQLACDLRLQDVVGSGRAATQMTLRHIGNDEACLPQQGLRRAGDLLAMLQRACGVVGNAHAHRLGRQVGMR